MAHDESYDFCCHWWLCSFDEKMAMTHGDMRSQVGLVGDSVSWTLHSFFPPNPTCQENMGVVWNQTASGASLVCCIISPERLSFHFARQQGISHWPGHRDTGHVFLEKLIPTRVTCIAHQFWLVVENISYCSICWEFHHPNWLIFFRGVGPTTNQYCTHTLISKGISWGLCKASTYVQWHKPRATPPPTKRKKNTVCFRFFKPCIAEKFYNF